MGNRSIYPSDEVEKYLLRLPEGMREQLKGAAKQNNRSMNGEIIHRLKASLSPIEEEGGAASQAEDLLQGKVTKFTYDFEEKRGYLHMEAGDCVDMNGCIEFFRRIDPAVVEIQTYSGQSEDTFYRWNEVKAFWSAHAGNPLRLLPQRVNERRN